MVKLTFFTSMQLGIINSLNRFHKICAGGFFILFVLYYLLLQNININYEYDLTKYRSYAYTLLNKMMQLQK